MRVAYVLEQCWNPVPGGTATAAIEVARALADRDDTDVIGVSAKHRRPAPPAFTPPVPMRELRLPRLGLYETWHLLRRPPVERATGAVDVIHATGLAIPPRTAPLVVTLHDLAWIHAPSQFSAKGRRFFKQAFELIDAEADLVLCSSEATRVDAERQGLSPERLRVVPLGAKPAISTVTPDDIVEVKRRYGIRGRFVLWVGTVEPRKNLPRLLDAFEAAVAEPLDGEPVELVLVGPDGWNERIEERLAILGERVRRVGFVPMRDRDVLYAGADVFVLPSLREGFGLPVLEAMAQGTAVITSSGTSTEEIVGEAGVTVDPLDTGSLTTAIRELLADTATRDRLGAAARERAKDFTWEKTAAATRSAYGDVA